MADSEDWNAEIQHNPENTFPLCAFQIQSDRQPKTAFLRYVHVTHYTGTCRWCGNGGVLCGYPL